MKFNVLNILIFISPFFLFADSGLRAYHRWNNYPANQGTCQKEADRIAEEAARNSGVRQEVGVGNFVKNSCTVELSYDFYYQPYCAATSWSKWEDNCSEFAGSPLEEDSWQYETMESCQVDLKNQLGNFERYTGVKPIVAHCFLNRIGQFPVLRLVGFGPYQLEGKVATPEVFPVVRVYENQDSLNREVENWLVTKGNFIFRKAYPREFLNAKSNYFIHYYSPPAAPFLEYFFGAKRKGILHPTPGACEEQRQVLNQALKSINVEPVAILCANAPGKEESMLYSIHKNTLKFKMEKTSNQYSNWDNCRADLPRVTRVYQEKLGVKVHAAFCYQNESVVEILLMRAGGK